MRAGGQRADNFGGVVVGSLWREIPEELREISKLGEPKWTGTVMASEVGEPKWTGTVTVSNHGEPKPNPPESHSRKSNSLSHTLVTSPRKAGGGGRTWSVVEHGGLWSSVEENGGL